MALYIGTSGWDYPHWEKVFYPPGLSSKDKLKYFSRHFEAVEINYSFYRLPKPAVYQNWHQQTSKEFLFALKVSRFITHIKRLKGVKTAWKTFVKNALNLEKKLGPVLFQFPSNFKATAENVKRLKEFLFICKSKKLRLAFEFRNESWCRDRIYEVLRKHNAAWVIADSPSYPKIEEVTADFVYLRMHGSRVLFSSRYTKKELENLAQKIKKWQKQKKDVFIFFNNDACGYAVKNAQTLVKLLT